MGYAPAPSLSQTMPYLASRYVSSWPAWCNLQKFITYFILICFRMKMDGVDGSVFNQFTSANTAAGLSINILNTFLYWYDSAAVVSPSLTTYLLSKGFSSQDIVAAGFSINATATASNPATKFYDRFRWVMHTPHTMRNTSRMLTLCYKYVDSRRDRMMIAIRNAEGRTVGFAGRDMNSGKRDESKGRKPAKYGNHRFQLAWLFCIFSK
jgi:hypothetical protein